MMGIGGGETLVLLVIVGLLALEILAIVDVARSEFRTPELKIVWLLVVILVGGIGPILYFAVGRGMRV